MSVIWITGAGGFLGGRLAQMCAGQGSRVGGFGPGFSEGQAGDVFAAVEAGYLCHPALDRMERKAGLPDTVFHLAGGSTVRGSVTDPQKDFAKSVESTAVLLHWLYLRGARPTVVLSSSAAVYGAELTSPARESDVLAPHSPYGAHKVVAEEMVAVYQPILAIDAAIVRLFSVYGPGLKKQFIWDFTRKVLEGSPVDRMFGTGTETRDWIYVDDACRLLMRAAERATKPLVTLNGGTGQGTEIATVASMICRLIGLRPELGYVGFREPSDPGYLVADTGYLASLGNFGCEVTLEAGLRETVAWIKTQTG